MKLCSFPFKGCFCHLKPKENTWSIKTSLFSWRTSAMLHRSSTRNLISWDSNSSFSCLSCCCACVLQHCNDNFYLQENHSKSKVKTARLPLEKMHVLQPALFLHPGSQRRFRREIAELPNCNLDHLFKVSSQEKESQDDRRATSAPLDCYRSLMI